MIDKLVYLKSMGVEPYISRAAVQATKQALAQPTNSPTVQAQPLSPPQHVSATLSTSEDRTTTVQWRTLANEVANCSQCVLHESRTQAVLGVGDRQAQWMFIGEAPGLDEDRKGEPFVGRAGQLLNKMLRAIGFNRNEVYIANIIKCRPPDNRNPRLEEIVQCLPYLHRQIQLVQPEIIVLLGGVAATSLLKEQTSVSRLRRQVHRIAEIAAPVIVTYHPAYLLRSPQQKSAAWEDLQFACKTIGRDL